MSTTNVDTKTAERCALIWFSISSEQVYEALVNNDFDRMRTLGLEIGPEAFRDVCAVLAKPQFKQCLQATRSLWLMWCSPPPCILASEAYESILRELKKTLGQKHEKR